MATVKSTPMPYGAYYKTEVPSHDPELTHTDRGTPMGEYMRRFWQPVCLSEQLTDVPQGDPDSRGESRRLPRSLGACWRYCSAIAVTAAPRSSTAPHFNPEREFAACLARVAPLTT